MRTDIKKIKASELKAGMTRCYTNPRMDELINEVSEAKDGWVKIESGDYTSTTYQEPNDIIWIKK